MFFSKNKAKGEVRYGVARFTDRGNLSVVFIKDTLEEAVDSLDRTWNLILEMTVTKVFVKNADLKEIETNENS